MKHIIGLYYNALIWIVGIFFLPSQERNEFLRLHSIIYNDDSLTCTILTKKLTLGTYL